MLVVEAGIDLEEADAQRHIRAQPIAQRGAPAGIGVIVPAGVARKGQRVRAEGGVHQVAADRHAAQVIAHREIADAQVQPAAIEILLDAEFGELGEVAARRFLDRQAVADDIRRDADAAPVVEREMEERARPADRPVEIDIDAGAQLLGIAGAALQAAIDGGEGLGDIIGAEADPRLAQVAARAAPIAGERLPIRGQQARLGRRRRFRLGMRS